MWDSSDKTQIKEQVVVKSDKKEVPWFTAPFVK